MPMRFRRIAFCLLLLPIFGAFLRGTPAHAGSPAAMPLLATPTFTSSNLYGHSLSIGSSARETTWRSYHTPTPRDPDWLAVDISRAHPRRVYLRWSANGTYFYNHNWYGGGPGYGIARDYTIDANSAPGGGTAAPKTGWVTLARVTGNSFHSRAHALTTQGYRWLRIRVTGVDGTTYNDDTVFSNFGVWDAGRGMRDTWLMLGDSIIDNSMSPDGFAGFVRAKDSSRFPAQENGGIGGSHTWDWLHWGAGGKIDNAGWIDQVLAMTPAHNIGISLGTNDYYGGVGSATERDYYNNLTALVHKVLAAGKVPYLSALFGSHTEGIQKSLASARRVHDRILAENPGCKPGPDFDTYFNNHPGLFDDPQHNVHPNGAGNAAIQRLWAQVALHAYPAPAGKTLRTSKNQ